METTKLKKGQKVARLLTRYNPQLGVYYVFEEIEVVKVNSKSVRCSDGKKYNNDGLDITRSLSVYGSCDYVIMPIETAAKRYNDLKKAGWMVRGMETTLGV